MSEKTTYYAMVNEFSSHERPGGVVRRVEDDNGQEDEAFTRNLAWEATPLLYSAERGDLTNQFYEITEDEAERIVARIRASVTGAPES
jgi:triphosphoribosyl-dephospho-CoA synthetase